MYYFILGYDIVRAMSPSALIPHAFQEVADEGEKPVLIRKSGAQEEMLTPPPPARIRKWEIATYAIYLLVVTFEPIRDVPENNIRSE